MQKKRIDWDEYYINIVKMVSTRSTCPRLRTGALIVKDNKIIGSGYNGAPKKMEHCDDVGCLIVEGHCIRTVHAEQNALLQAGTEAKNATMYCLGIPCPICYKLCIQAEIKKIIYTTDYRKELSEYWINNGGVELIKYGQ